MRLRTSITAGLALLLAAGAAWSASAPPAKATRSSAKPAVGSRSRGKRSSKHSNRRERGQKTPAPQRISEVQQALPQDGSFHGTPNGKWDHSTVDSMRKFQTGHGLNPSGQRDARTLQKLRLGSQTAGVAAPKWPVATSTPATTPAQTTRQ